MTILGLFFLSYTYFLFTIYCIAMVTDFDFDKLCSGGLLGCTWLLYYRLLYCKVWWVRLISLNVYKIELHRRCNGEHDRLECSKSWVRVLVGSNPRPLNWYLVVLHEARNIGEKDWLTRNQHAYVKRHISTSGLLLERASTIRI